MTRPELPAQIALFDASAPDRWGRLELEPSAVVLQGFAFDEAPALLAGVERIARDAPWRHMTEPIVSVSLGAPASFLWGGRTRAERPRRLLLVHGDVVVWGGPARLNFHGVEELRPTPTSSPAMFAST